VSIITVSHLHAIRELGRQNNAARVGSSSGLIRLVLPIFAVTFGMLATSAQANDPCSTVGTTTTCSGDQSAGIAFNPNIGITSLWVQSLTLPITPPAGTSGINFQSLGANGVAGSQPAGLPGSDLSTTTDKSVSISTSGGAPGILVTSTGANGADAVFLVSPGGAGAQGGAITVGNGGSITTAGANAIGISAQSIGGTAGLNAITGGGGLGGVVTVTNSGSIATNGTNAYGIAALSAGGNGFLQSQDNGAAGASSGNINVTNSGSITTQLNGSSGIFASSLGGTTRNSSTNGAGAGSITIGNTGTITTSGSTTIPLFPLPFTFANGIMALGTGGAGSDGENENRLGSASGGNAGSGGVGSAIGVNSSGTITTNGNGSFGIYLHSLGGAGGTGGAAGERGSTDTGGGNGGTGGAGGGVTVTASGKMTTSGAAIVALSTGGVGGNGGSATGGTAVGRDGGTGGTGGDVTVTTTGLSLVTTGTTSVGSLLFTTGAFVGILAQSQGGNGGNGGDASDSLTINGTSGNGGGGGTGGAVTMSGSGSVMTAGAGAVGIYGQSIGGNGGNGANALGSFNADARNGGAGGAGGTVAISTSVNVTTNGNGAYGIAALSQGGNSGNGGHAFSLANANAGNSADAGSGGMISLTSSGTVMTGGSGASALFALSAGGNGGSGNSGDAAVAAGGNGGNGGGGGAVTVNANGIVGSTGASAYGVSAQSVGGTGGNGDSAGGAGGSGGTGGTGGAGVAVIVNANGKITTGGELANGVFAFSGGGAGGTGGSATGAFVTNGGTGGAGGAGGTVTVTTAANSTISTSGALATGVFARSLGAAGGNGGNSGAAFNTPGGGGAGGISDVVTVTANGAITTSGFGAFGIQAESTGGGGGTAANGSGIVSVGGTGGAASSGGFVNVTNNGSIATSGLFAHGIAAGSIGGGGGAGSQANDLVALGGSGNSSGDGNSVTITNAASGTIQTSGLGAYGIYAESVGGGGGNGGGAKGLVSIGGAGSTGGNGGQVNVINNGAIATSGIGGNGIFAQSVGGGGGDGGSASSFAALASVAIGGSGGVAGNGSLVLVDNTGTIQVSGFRSSAIFAQSLGGGGGNGGDGTLDCGCLVQYAVGGKGGSSGTGGDVRVFNSGTISSISDLAPAIFAQSVGGGGGSGGAGYGFGAGVFNVGISVGGAGGSAGGGGTVSVDQSGAIVTTGMNSNGITAYSIGGGGGNGGSSASRTASALFGPGLGGGSGGGGSGGGGSPPGGSGPSTIGLDFSFGGSGGSAGDGGAVNVSNTGFIVTGGAASSGIFAQSVGGGGGNGGDASATSTAVNEGTASTISLALSIGGQGGAGGKGGTVTVNNVGKIFTVGDEAPAIVAQSVGGGGGMGGAGVASSDTVGNINNFLPGNIVNPNPNTPPSDPGVPNSTDRSKLEQLANGTKEGTKISVAVGIGGNGGTANDGGDIHVTNDGSIVTFGFASQGIFAQSIGGGGGTAGGGGGQSSGGIAVGVGVSGQGGGGGKGGDISVTNSGTIFTFGDDATAIFAQSIGGGGGVAMVGDGHVGLNPKGIAIAIGGTTGSSGAGGNITVTQNGAITTIGDRAYGILAESIGGGGGVGGTGDGVNLGAVVVGGKGGAGGSGGTVKITDTGGITTYGNGADGIVAQSIGGGGGIGGDAAGSNPHLGSRATTVGVGVGGAAGEAGDGQAVTISSTGSITTSGIAAYGILAQSIGGGGGFGGSGNASGGTIAFAGSNGGNGAGGAITIDQTGNVKANGLDSHAIFAQSVGGNGGGNITVNIHGGTISGGTGSAAGIYIDGGNTNAINISSGAMVTAQSGFAIQATDGVDQNGVARVIGKTTVNNSGSITGNVDLGIGAGQVNNLAGATFVTGQVLNLGSGALVNAGRLDLGGVGNVITTVLTGDFAQTTKGTYAVDVRFGGTSDLLAVNGIANVRGTIEPHVSSLLPNTPATILTATGGFIGVNDVTAINSPTVTYGVRFVGNSLQLVALQAQFVNPTFSTVLTPNELAVANQLQNIWNAGATPGIGPTFATLANLTDPQSYAQVMDRLHPGPYLAQAAISTFTGLSFVDSMLSCHLPTGPYAPLTEVPCDWAKLTGAFSSEGSSSSSTGYRDQAARLQAGRQIQLAPDWFGEFAVSYETGHTTSGTFATTSADRYDFGAAIKHQIGPWLFAAALDAGYDALNTTRYINFAGAAAATSTPSVWRLDSRFRAAYVAESNGFYVKPSFDIDTIYTALPGFSEWGAGALGLNVAAAHKVTFAATPMFELGKTWLLANGSTLRPYIQAGATVFSNNTWSLNSTFEGAPAGTAPFTTLSSLPQTLWKVSAGIDIFRVAQIPDLDLRLEYEGRFGASYNDQTGLVKLSRHF
jgi:hypothetical protein